MHYDFIAIPDADVPQAIEPVFQHVVTTYASEANKTVSMWRAVPDALLDFKPHEKTNPIRTILVHQLLSERRFFAQFVGTEEPPVEELLPPGEKPSVPGVHRQVHLAGEATAAAVGRRHRRLVAGAAALLRRLATGTDLGLLAAGAAHLPPPDPGADVAALAGHEPVAYPKDSAVTPPLKWVVGSSMPASLNFARPLSVTTTPRFFGSRWFASESRKTCRRAGRACNRCRSAGSGR